MPADNTYKIRRSKAGSKKHPYNAYSVTVPSHIAEAIKDIDEKRFRWEFTDDGLLLKPVVENGQPEVEVPAWAR